MALTNPFSYSARTFETLLQCINNDDELRDKPNWWKRGIAGVGDVASLWVDAAANNNLLATAYTRKAVQLLLELIDYSLAPHSTASGNLIFYVKSTAIFPFTVTISDLVAMTAGSTSVSSKRFEARSGVTVTDVNETFLPAAVNVGANKITVARSFTTGERVRFTSSGTLPAPLAAGTDYYAIRLSATEIKIAASIINALSGTAITLTTQGAGNHNVKLYSFILTCYQQQKKGPVIIGQSDGITKNQEFELGDIDILRDTLTININSTPWQRVASFIDSTSTDKHFRLFYNTDNSAIIQFGDGVYGAIPGSFEISAEYATGGGLYSNVTVLNKINIYGGSDSNINGVTNAVFITGGSDPQSISNAKVLGPMLLKTRSRYITTSDCEALALDYGGISQVNAIKNAYGVLSSKVVCVANGGGNPSAPTRAALQEYLIDRTVCESVDVRVVETTITAKNITAAGKVKTGYLWSGQVQNWFRMAWQLFFTETGEEIVAKYLSDGVDEARALMNIIFTESYIVSDNAQIRRFLDNLQPRYIGEGEIQETDYISFVGAFTDGLDYFTTTLSGDISIAEDEITTIGTLTLTEIV